MSIASTLPNRLNSSGCMIKHIVGKGRGVYTSYAIPRQTIIEVSPVLLFSKEEYNEHGKYTILDQYTFKWTDGRMALALGLGSLFNRSETPNVSYIIEPSTDSIQYITARDVGPDEELCIFYGHDLWFSPIDSLIRSGPSIEAQGEHEDGWGGLSTVDEAISTSVQPSIDELFLDGDPDEIIADEQLPFVRFKLPPEEEDPDSICTVQAWVVDIPDPRLITTMLKWLKQTGLETSDLGHLKRIRKYGGVATLLLTTSPTVPILPEGLGLPDPYTLFVPVSPARTPISLTLKSSLWPTVYAPLKKGEVEGWSRGKVRWAWEAVQALVKAAVEAQTHGELPIAAYIPAPYGAKEEDRASITFMACDTRKSNAHPLRHAVFNVIRRMADYRASTNTLSPPFENQAVSSTSPDPEESRNGTNYLLTSLTLFTTHEPCIMCSMALIHSRVKEVIYLYPMPKTGGCGGIACLSTLKGVNHRFGICRWKANGNNIDCLSVDNVIDA